MTLLGELKPYKGKSQLIGQVAYVPQESWVFSGTIKDNILFGEECNAERYEQTVKACSLKTVSLYIYICQTLLSRCFNMIYIDYVFIIW